MAEESRDALPVDPHNEVLDKTAFLYDATENGYVCPMGKTLDYVGNKPYQRQPHKGTYGV